MSRSPEARRKILNVATAIKTEPHRYAQDQFASITTGSWLAWGAPKQWFIDAKSPACDTAFCIAGWNHALHHQPTEALRIGYDIMDDRRMVYWEESPTTQFRDQLVDDFELTDDEASLLVFRGWRPKFGVTVAQALELIAHGASVFDISSNDAINEWW